MRPKTFFTIRYSPIPANIGLFQKRKLQGLVKNNVEFENIFKHAVVYTLN